MNIYVGNVSYKFTNDELHEAFAEYGTVDSARIIMDRDTGRSKGFAFVEMPNDNEGQAAIDALNGTEIGGRELKVNEARPKPPRNGGGGGGGRRFNNSGGGGGRPRF